MGLTSWIGGSPRITDVEIAKKYLIHDELEALNRIVSLYLDFAELQVLNRKAMDRWDPIAKLDDFLHLSEQDMLIHVGTVSHAHAIKMHILNMRNILKLIWIKESPFKGIFRKQ